MATALPKRTQLHGPMDLIFLLPVLHAVVCSMLSVVTSVSTPILFAEHYVVPCYKECAWFGMMEQVALHEQFWLDAVDGTYCLPSEYYGT